MRNPYISFLCRFTSLILCSLALNISITRQICSHSFLQSSSNSATVVYICCWHFVAETAQNKLLTYIVSSELLFLHVRPKCCHNQSRRNGNLTPLGKNLTRQIVFKWYEENKVSQYSTAKHSNPFQLWQISFSLNWSLILSILLIWHNPCTYRHFEHVFQSWRYYLQLANMFRDQFSVNKFKSPILMHLTF